MTVHVSVMVRAKRHDALDPRSQRDDRWDFAIGIGGAAAALLAGGAMYVGHRAQARREQRFGESLREQLTRRIAQLDDRATIS